jgi:hypothetical protein
VSLEREAWRWLAIEQLAHVLQPLGWYVEQSRGVGRAERPSGSKQEGYQVSGELGVGDIARVQQHQAGAIVTRRACSGGFQQSPGHVF